MYHDTFRPMDWLKDLTRLFRTCWLNLSLISRRAGRSTWIHVCMRTTLPGMSHLSTVPSRLWLESVKANIVTAQKRQKERYDRKHSNPEVFAVGALVLKKDFTRKKHAGGKLDYRWTGPYRISCALGRGLYRLQEVQNPTKIVTRVNGVHLKKYLLKQVCIVEGSL